MDGDALRYLIPLAGIVLGSLMFLIPIAGLTARFAVKPVLEAIRGAREGQAGSNARELAVLEQRVALLEQQFQGLENSVERLSEVKDFERRLGVPPRAE
jgi:TolA-binding protein